MSLENSSGRIELAMKSNRLELKRKKQYNQEVRQSNAESFCKAID